MATSLNNFDASGEVRVEVEAAGGGYAYDKELARALVLITTSVMGTVNQMPTEQRPQEVSLTCGLKALPSGGFAISLGETAASFTLTLSWRSDSSQSPLGGLVPAEPGPGA